MPPARLAEFDKAWESYDGAGKHAGAAGLSVGNIRDVMSSSRVPPSGDCRSIALG